ncbi:hypothetical protein BKA70DRAFT_692798 [Coprinopsis sp. MPI-PUGE-AT-0042]|nr:hypothetical protein BKA70DRAFT_692798 [Coprinopsis sp. MPI-PUGE-AT-0042]
MVDLTLPLRKVVEETTAADFYVSPSGNDSAAGTLATPFKTIQKGIDTATAGSTVYLRVGTYAPSTNVTVKVWHCECSLHVEGVLWREGCAGWRDYASYPPLR